MVAGHPLALARSAIGTHEVATVGLLRAAFDKPMLYWETTGSVHSASQEADMASNGNRVDLRAEMVNLLIQKIASDRNPSVTMMKLVESVLAPDDVPAYVAVLMDKVKAERYPSFSMIRRILALTS